MRVGLNPAKRSALRAHRHGSLGMACLVYIPSRQGYFEHALDVLQQHLESLRCTLPADGEIIVWDNGSHASVRAFLVDQLAAGHIDYLFLSRHNLGKTGALNWLLASLPHPYIGYTDGDVYFMPGWWEATQRIFQRIPQAGMVSAQPAFFDVLRGASRTPRMAQDAGWEVRHVPADPATYRLYRRGLGHDPDAPIPEVPVLRAPGDARPLAVLRATHMQFVMPREVARAIVPLPVRGALHRDDDRALHERVEALGRWQLSTFQSYLYHMGNQPWHPELPSTHAEATRAAVPPPRAPMRPKQRVFRWLQRQVRRSARLQRWTERLYHVLFRLLYEPPTSYP